MLLKTSVYVKRYDGQTKWMYFLIEYNDLLEKYNTGWVKVSADIRKEFDSEHVYNEKFSKTKKKSYIDTCLEIISIDSALKKEKIYYLQVFLKTCKYIGKKKTD